MFDELDDLGEYEFFKVSFWKPAAKAAAAGRKVFIQGIRTGMKAKTPAQKALALRLKGQGKKMLGRSARGSSEGADSEGAARKRKYKPMASRLMEGSDAHSMNPHPERDDDGW